MDRAEKLAADIASELRTRPRVLVGLDGPDAAGKTVLADRVAGLLPSEPVRISIDGFHRPAVQRRAREDLSPAGYYADTFNSPDVVTVLERVRMRAG